MKSATRAPWLSPQRIDSLVQPEPLVLLVVSAALLWVLYVALLRGASAERHRILRAGLGNLTVHVVALVALASAYFGLDVTWLEHSALARLEPYVGLAVLIQGATVLTKLLKMLAMELLFLGHMREFVPALLINTLTGAVACINTAWLAAAVFDLQLGPLLATSAAASLVLGLAAQDTLGNLFAGIAMQFDKPYEIGDWVEVTGASGKFVGQVQDITWRATALVGMADELISIPNRVVGQSNINNFSQRGVPVARVLLLHLPLDAELARVRQIVLGALQGAEGTAIVPGVVTTPQPKIFFSELGDAWVVAKILYWIDDYGQQLGIADRVLTAVLSALRQQSQAVALPQLVVAKP